MKLSRRQTFAVMIAASFASTIGGLPFNSLPILLGSLAEQFTLSAQQIGFLGSACFTGYFAGTLAAFFIMNHISWRKLTVLSAVFASLALFLSSFAQWDYQMFLWAVLGFFAALMTCLGLRIMGEMQNKERALGLRQGIELGFTALVLFILPAYITAQYGYQGAAIALLLIIILLSLSAFLLPERSTTHRTETGFWSRLKLPTMAWLALLIFLLFGAGNIGLWAFLERMGNSIDLAPKELGVVFAVLKLLGGAAAFVIAIVGDRLGMRLPHFVVLIVIGIGLLLLWQASDFIMFALGAWIWEIGFTWGCVYQTATIARLDTQGKAIMLIPAAFGLSSMAGPAVAGMISANSYWPILIFAFVTSLIAVIVFITVMARFVAQTVSDTDKKAPMSDVA